MATSDAADALEGRLTQLRATDAEAFMEVLFREFYRPLGSVIQRVVKDKEATEDLLQDVFLRIWHGRDTLVITTTYRAYLYRAALNAALRYQEREQRQVAWDDAPAAAEPRTDNALHALYQREAEDSVEAALDRLPPQCRAVFTMSRYEEMSYQQIADTLEISPKTVENQMGKALRILRQQLSSVLKNLYSLLL
ncbi:RNA polymerase sigma-70 factor [Hymenobacter chitinivorans]|uniref:RNA polymerase sigma-70 factor (ECF subfamily) n=1 Tax=Hymenobacter chitinivorans DSM 11115 TaxID=1121954 RepID=A0A2M9ASX8_9BACT|nr:RNA polymerase sigma-70 factor [Hymenobacter chitinivorans]PJJ48777.1 RNA polymerase sigma-70 factor (ECF subfamily) [Hymenobacter chitinivorans DSM 11115]